MDKLLGLAGTLAFVVPGLGLLQLLPRLSPRSWVLRLPIAYLLGVAWTAEILYALSHVFSAPLRLPLVVVALAAPAAAGWGWRLRHRRRARAPARRWDHLERATLAVALLIFLGILAEAVTNPLRDWDGRMTWVAQARYVRAAGTVDAPVLRQPQWFVNHPRYPLLLPLSQAAALELVRGGDDSNAYRPLYAAFFPVLLALVHGFPRRRVSRRAAALTVLSAAVLPFVAYGGAGGAISAYSDLALSCFFGGGLLLLLGARGGAGEGLAAGLLLAAAALSKNEGTPLALAALVLGLAARWPRRGAAGGLRRLAPVGAAAAVVASSLILLTSWRMGIPNRNDEGYETLLSLRALWPALVTRLPLLLSEARRRMVVFNDWRLFWSAAPLVLLAGYRGLRRRPAVWLALGALAPLGVLWLAFAVNPRPALLLEVTWDRFLVQGLVPWLTLLSFALDDLLRRRRFPKRSQGEERIRQIST